MCLSPVIINNMRKRIPRTGGIKFKLDVPCGHCVECQKRKSDEYYLRSHYEALDCISKGGFILFDTLTYSDKFLPHIKDFYPFIADSLNYPCFNYKDIRYFLVRLRRNLSKRFDIKDKLRYFVSSEYGTDPNKSHRPHYHILFFVYNNELDPITLSRAVSDNWQLGRTDGVLFRGESYIKNHNSIGYYGQFDFPSVQRVCDYVTKYVQKSSAFSRVIRLRADYIVKSLYDDPKSYDARKYRLAVMRNLGEFHRQSEGFGLSALSHFDMGLLYDTGMVSMKDYKHIVRHIPVPVYYQRKLFYDLLKTPDGYRWQLNENGIDYKNHRVERQIQMVSFRFSDWFNQLEDEFIKNKVSYYLGSRSWSDFATYLLFYKGTIKSDSQIKRENSGVYKCDDLDTLLLERFSYDEEKGYYNYNSPLALRDFGVKFLSNGWIGDIDDKKSTAHYLNKYRYNHSLERVILGIPWMYTNKQFLSKVVSQYSDPLFLDFDEIFDIYTRTMYEKNVSKQKAFELTQRYKNIYKLLNL